MWGWLRELLEIRREGRVCQSCEILKVELSRERAEKDRLLNHILIPQPKEPERIIAPEPQVPLTAKHIPWKVRQQMLEAEDREKAQAIDRFRKKETELRKGPVVTENLEETLGIVEEK